MTGKELKDKLAPLGYTHKQIADKIGVSGQALDATLKSPGVKSNIIELMAERLGVGMSFFYPEVKVESKAVDGQVLKDLLEQNKHLLNIISKMVE